MKKGNYNCFSYNQMRYLTEVGIEPIHVMLHEKSGNTFWIFKRTEVLDIMLNKWSRKANLYKSEPNIIRDQ